MERLEILVGGAADTTGRRGARLSAAADTGRLLRLAPARYVDADAWRRADPGTRHVARVRAVHGRLSERLIVSHASAAALHGLPWRGEFPDVVEVIDTQRTTTQSLRSVRKHPGQDRSLQTVRMTTTGRRVTDIVVTAIDIAIAYELRLSVPILDVVLRRGVDRAALTTELAGRSAVHGRARATAAIELADALSGSPGESVARVALDEVGAPRPELQREFHDDAGFVARVDFWFPEQGIVLEFDGRAKYTDASMRDAGTTAADVVYAEKRREDRLRRVPGVNGIGRFGWTEANDAELLRALLRSCGVPMVERSFRTVR
ncbi:hypothetical protein EDF24_1945 [Curtobacterium sp. PhB130]|uniref:hypothetical protein n=1 Tax=Curtobacterium sp. PhB130 TaxID=2485178 RepID=UPI000F4CD313|nr:hypothetical protein [Curtobacterium sp. PhB130]ROS76356.1 hypothetical protein EDF24_1945 [Curtobacterium sp. PhB130]